MGSLFGRELEQHERERHASLLAHRRDACRDLDGFVTVGEAANTMRVSPSEVSELARQGALEWADVGGRILVRPAKVSKLGVRQEH